MCLVAYASWQLQHMCVHSTGLPRLLLLLLLLVLRSLLSPKVFRV